MSFINELKMRRDLLVNPESLVEASGSCLDEVSRRLINNVSYQLEIREVEQRKYSAQSSCCDRS